MSDQAGHHHAALGKGNHHKGLGTAGNKSLRSFRSGFGITGYAGYIPSTEAVPVPSKDGPSLRDIGGNFERSIPEAKNTSPTKRLATSVYGGTIAKLAESPMKGAERCDKAS